MSNAVPKKIKKLPRITFPLGDRVKVDFEKEDFEEGFLTAFLLAMMELRVWGQKYKFASANIKKRKIYLKDLLIDLSTFLQSVKNIGKINNHSNDSSDHCSEEDGACGNIFYTANLYVKIWVNKIGYIFNSRI